MPKPVLDSMLAHLELEAQVGGYEAAAQAHDASSIPTMLLPR